MSETGLIYIPSDLDGLLRQGEILSHLIQMVQSLDTVGSGTSPVVDTITHPFVVALTQDCDLDWDFKARRGATSEHKLIPNILFCEMTSVETLSGRSDIKSDIWRRITANKDERYQVLSAVPPGDDAAREGTPALAIDFKRYFTIRTDDLYYQLQSGIRRRSILRSPFREHLCSRFFYYQARIALPSEHVV